MSIKELKEKEKEKRRNYIIDAAEKLIFSKGYDNVSMKDIADEVGISRAALYLYFKNKEDIYVAIVLRASRIMNKMFKESVKSEKNGLNKLGDLGRVYFEFYKKFPDYYEIYAYFNFNKFLESDNGYISELKVLSYDIGRIIQESIKEGIKDGSIRADLNPFEVSIFLLSTSREIVKRDIYTIKSLKSQGISHEQYIMDAMDLYKRMLMNTRK